MKVNPHMFRAYDLRGLDGIDLTPEIVLNIAKAHGAYLVSRGHTKALVGRDSRKNSPIYSQKMIEGFRWSGLDVTDIGMVMIGTFYWAQHYLKIPGGIFVTASHNPPKFNGFKIANDYSETLVTEGMQELLKRVQEEDYIQGKKLGSVVQKDVLPAYYDDLVKRLPIKKKLKVMIDGGNSTSSITMPELLRRAGCEVVEYNTNIDPSFPLGVADPTEAKVMERIREEVLESKADIGFTYDSDADRIGIVDENGNFVWNDVLVAMFAADVLKDHPGATIVYNTLCSKAVPETIVREGGKPYMWRTGHSFIKAKGAEINSAFSGELSGHFFFSADFYYHEDGAYSTLRLLHYLSQTNQKLSEAVASLPQYISSPEIKVFCADDKKVRLMDKIAPVLKKDYPRAKIVDNINDGVRLDLPDAMFVVRYSQNGPYLTIKFEAKTQKEYDELRDYISKLLHKYPEIDWESDISLNIEALEAI